MTCNLLKGKKGLIFGVLNDKSIAWKVAKKSFSEGAELVFTNTAAARRLGDIDQLAKKCNAEVITADATSMEDINILLSKTMQIFGGKFDFILHSIGMSQNVRKGMSYDELNYAFFTKTLDISALSFHRVLSTAYKMDAIN